MADTPSQTAICVRHIPGTMSNTAGKSVFNPDSAKTQGRQAREVPGRQEMW
ncbi:hypothetical protein THTE_2445 [Thermogutta terrifontis]|uniref:Uncharacterized protein n=1 Tax=Thermogutta terrifontis TaxID=1331910 RepID=A0A286RGH5_9BACT|nr:hypothetical protein THTE_2445 [Thermogutta terrifontis]